MDCSEGFFQKGAASTMTQEDISLMMNFFNS